MKKVLAGVAVALGTSVLLAAPAAAAPGGAPAVHGVDGKTFGMVVSGLATSSPGALAAHTSGR